jgi:16S rRNA (adenine1518-N6/adenine1519-N6)-dimethyltransferase
MTGSIRPLKKFGQNFLTNQNIAEKIVNTIEPGSDDIIIEIGPGKGVLTKILASKNVGRIIAVEVDERLLDNLFDITSANTNLQILHDDILNTQFEQLDIPGSDIKILGNIPYNLTSGILFKLYDNYRMISKAVLMIQKEVADRLISKPGSKDYGILSVLTALHGRVKKEFEVKRTNFYPAPNVDSAVISIDFYSALDGLVDYDIFVYIVKGCFQTRRKMLQNSLKRIFNKDLTGSIQKIDLKKRPEDLSVQEFVALSNEITDLNKAK